MEKNKCEFKVYCLYFKTFNFLLSYIIVSKYCLHTVAFILKYLICCLAISLLRNTGYILLVYVQ